MGNRMKVLQDSMSQHTVTKRDKLKLVNYNHKICNTKIFQVQNFGRKNFDDSTCTRQIRQTFLPSKFYAMWYILWVHIHNTDGDIILGFCYCSPGSPIEILDKLVQSLSQIQTMYIIIGDFNAPSINMSNKLLQLLC